MLVQAAWFCYAKRACSRGPCFRHLVVLDDEVCWWTITVPEPATIGIVAIGRNEGARLEQCLRSLLSQSHAVIYADSASSDGSADLARRLGVETVELSGDQLAPYTAGGTARYPPQEEPSGSELLWKMYQLERRLQPPQKRSNQVLNSRF